MQKKSILFFLSSLILTLVISMALNLVEPVKTSAQTTNNILISAAASLKDALEEIKPQFEKANPSTRVSYNFGSSGALQQQIEQGAPADVFISAATRQMDTLEKAGLINKSTRRNLLTNGLVLIVPSNSTLNIKDFRSLTDSRVRRISVGEPRSVPVGQYTEEVFTKLGILDQVRPKLVFGNSVRNVLASVESGNADAGVVYATDAKISDRVKVVATAANNSHSPIVYPMAVIESSKNPRAAKAYADYLTTAPAKKIFEKFGFGIAR